MKFDHNAVYDEKIAPLVAEINALCQQAGISAIALFDVSADDESEEAYAELQRSIMLFNTEYLSFPVAIAFKVLTDPEFAKRLEAIMGVLQMSDQDILLDSVSPAMRKILTPRK